MRIRPGSSGAVSEDGLTFQMDPTAGDRARVRNRLMPAGSRTRRCVQTDDGTHGLLHRRESGRRQGSMLLATGPDPYTLKKREVVLEGAGRRGQFQGSDLASGPGQELAAVLRICARRRLADRHGQGGRAGREWAAMEEMVPIREDSWDNWHLSPGPIIQCPGRDPVMFYNGATHDARWRIGWVTFDQAASASPAVGWSRY